MSNRYPWLPIFVTLLTVAIAACGPAGTDPDSESVLSPTIIATEETAESSPDIIANVETNIDAREYDENGIEVGFTEDGYPYRGNPNAPIVIEEFSDFQCPFCARYFSETLPDLMKNQIADGQVVTIFYDFPLTSIHPQAAAAAHAARCAGEQGAAAYWAMHDEIFTNGADWSNNNADAVFTGFAQDLGLEIAKFEACQSSNKFDEAIRNDIDLAISRGISSTPSFYVNDQILVGAQPISVFNQAIATIADGGQLPTSEPEPTRPPAEPTIVTGSPVIEPKPAAVPITNFAAELGDPNAPVTIVEYTDYQCPYCQRYSLETLPQLMTDLIETGRVYYVLKDFPLDSLHPDARTAATAARCAGEQDAYWEMHDAVFESQAAWTDQDAAQVLTETAANLGLDMEVYEECVASGRQDMAIQENLDEGAALGVTGTPSFFINGYSFSGSLSLETIVNAVGLAEDGALADLFRPPSIGDPDAPVIIVEYTDYECPFCSRHFLETFPEIKENYIDKGLVRYVFKDFPLTNMHPRASAAAFAARCAGDQDAYAEMHDILFVKQQEWGQAQDFETLLGMFNEYADELALETPKFTECLFSGKHQSAVVADLREAAAFGINGTPAFFINETFLSGAQPFSEFERIIEEMLDQ